MRKLGKDRMKKVVTDLSKHFCPHPMPLFLFGTYDTSDMPNYGLFCWLNFCWDNELAIMACLDGEKLTKDRIKATGEFSANLVTDSMLPLADYLGHRKGYDTEEPPFDIQTVPGEKLHVPVLEESPLTYELKVTSTISLKGSDVFICHIRNAMVQESILTAKDVYDLSLVNPAITSLEQYYALSHKGAWGQWKNTKEI